MTDTQPAVSVIVPCYRVTEYIPEALDSLCAQSLRDFEAIVSNDGCPDTANQECVVSTLTGKGDDAARY
jgi:glycosyltransferase involved in cell wall biosynthesis